MKRVFAALCVLVLLGTASLCTGCGGIDTVVSAPETAPAYAQPEQAGEAEDVAPPLERGELRSIGGYMGDINNERGFFMTEMVQSNEYANLMWYDYETLRQQYYCRQEGCAHDSTDCQSYMPHGGAAYLYGDMMFVNYGYYGDGSSLLGMHFEDGITQVLLRRPEYELQLLELYCDGAYLYFMDGYDFVSLNIETREITTLYSQNAPFVDAETGQEYPPMVQCSPKGFVLDGKMPLELFDPETGFYLVLVGPEGDTTVHYSWPNEGLWYHWYPGGIGYAVEGETGHIYRYDLATRQETMVTDAFAFENKTIGPDMGWEEESWYPAANTWYVRPVGDWLMVNLWEVVDTYGTKEWAYLYNPESGEVREHGLGDYYFSYTHNLRVWGETPHGLLVTEDTREAMVHGVGYDGAPYQFDTVYYVYALMDLEDFINSNPAFNTIVPVEYTAY